jgi:PAS domain S-box-containing protein
MLDINNIYIQLGGLVGVIGILWKIFSKARAIITAGVDRIAFIYDQVRPNGGNSLYDITMETKKVALIERDARHFQWAMGEKATMECDSSGQCVWVSRRMAEIFGLEHAEMLGRGWLDAVDHKTRAKVWERWQDAIESRIPYADEFLVINQSTSDKVWCRASAQAAIIDGKLARFFVVVNPMRAGVVSVEGKEIDSGEQVG